MKTHCAPLLSLSRPLALRSATTLARSSTKSIRPVSITSSNDARVISSITGCHRATTAKERVVPLAEVDRIAKLVPEQLKMTIKKAMEEEPKLREMAAADPQVRELLNISMTLEGLARHTSTHAAGVVISSQPLSDLAPLWKRLPRQKKRSLI